MTPMQRRMLTLLLRTPGQTAGQLQNLLRLSRWNPAPTKQGVSRSLTGLLGKGYVSAKVLGEHDLNYFLTSTGRIAVVSPARSRAA